MAPAVVRVGLGVAVACLAPSQAVAAASEAWCRGESLFASALMALCVVLSDLNTA